MTVRDWRKNHHVRGAGIGVAFGTVLLLVLGFLSPGSGADSVPCGARVAIKVVSSTEKKEALEELASLYAREERRPLGRTCAAVTVVGVSSGVAEQVLAGSRENPAITDEDRTETAGAQVWTPSSTLWLDRLRRDSTDGILLKNEPPSLARSPMVLAMPRKLAENLHWDRKPPTWHAVMESLRKQEIKYTQENPRTSTSGSMATYLTFAAAHLELQAGENHKLDPQRVKREDAASPAIGGYVQQVQRAADGGFVNDSTDILRGWASLDRTKDGAPEDTLLMIQEQMVWGYNTGQYSPPDKDGSKRPPTAPLVAVHPVAEDGSRTESLVTDHPYVTLPNASPEERKAAEDFHDFVMQDGRQVLCRHGFQPRKGMKAASCPVPQGAEHIRRIDLDKDFQTLKLPHVDAQEEMVEQWQKLKAPRRVLIVMDVSGSMVNDRLESAVAAIKASIVGVLRKEDQVGVVQFAGKKGFRRPYWEVLPMGEKGNMSRVDDPHLARLDDTPDTEERQQTAFLVTADYAYREMSRKHREDGTDVVDVVVIISDGIDDWTSQSTSVEDICQRWKAEGLTAVPVHTIYYEPHPKEYPPARVTGGRTALARLAQCAGRPGTALESKLPGAAPESKADPFLTVFSKIMGAL